MSTIPEPQTTTAVTQRESAVATPIDIIAPLASVISLIILLLMIGGIVLAIIKMFRKRHIKDIQVKYISSEGGYLATEDSSRVDGGFDNQIVSVNSILSMKFPMILISLQYSNSSSSDPEYDSVDNNSISADNNVKSNGLGSATQSKPQESRSDNFRNRMVCIMIRHAIFPLKCM